MAKQNTAHITMWGKSVGELTYNESSDACTFRYDPSWINTGIEVSPLQLPLSDRTYQFPGLPYATFKGLPGVFADSLPDAFGNAVIDAWLAHTGRHKECFNSIERLLFTGSRGVGALEYSPVIENNLNRNEPLDLHSLVEMAQWSLNIRAGLQESFADRNHGSLEALTRVSSCVGGARPKAVIGINTNRTEILGGHTDLPEGFTHYLLKFDGVVEPSKSNETFGDPQGYGRMEFAYFLMAQAAGLNISHCELILEGERAHFVTQRFDRVGNQKLHCQSLCAMGHADYQQPGRYSYEELFAIVHALKMPESQVLELYRRMVFNIIARNHDDHAKNFGFILNQQNQWRLAPAFDIAFSYRPGSKWINSHQMALNGKREDFTREDLLAPADQFRDEALEIIEQVTDVVSQWPQYAKEAGVFADYSYEVQAGHRLHL